MPKQSVQFIAFNRGMVSNLALARADVKRVALSAQVFTNFRPRVLGSMMLRPGLGYLGHIFNDAAKTKMVPHVFSTSDVSLVEFTDSNMRVWIGDALLTRAAVASAVLNGTFAGNINNWSNNSDGGATAPAYAVLNGNGTMQLASNGTARSIGYQQVNVAAPDQNKEHALRIKIENGPMTLRIGTALEDDTYVNQTVLDTGYHSIAFTPGATFFIQFSSVYNRTVNVSNCTIEAAGVVVIPSPYLAADLKKIKHDQSGDIVYLGCKTYQQRRIERRGTRPGARSWSLCLDRSDNGPFMVQNTSNLSLTPGALTGNTTLTASQPLFRASHVGALFSHTSSGQVTTKVMALLNDVTANVKVTGIGTARAVGITLSGVTAGRTIILEYSYDTITWFAAPGESWTADVVAGYNDGLNNQTVYYRLRLTVVGGAGNTTATLTVGAGTIRGIARVTSITSNLIANVEVITAFGNTTSSTIWEEGLWSTKNGWPTAGSIFEDRMWWAGQNGIGGSQVDAFDGYDETDASDAGPINRVIGSGPVDTINWVLPLLRLILGSEGSEVSCRSSSLDEALTPSNFNLKWASTQGSNFVQGRVIDKTGVYVQRGGQRLFELVFNIQSYEYESVHLSALIPDIGAPGITNLSVQRQVDTIIHAPRTDGTVVNCLRDALENVVCFYLTTSPGAGGTIIDTVIVPNGDGTTEDQVYYVVQRTINGAAVTYLEKMALQTEAIGGTITKLADAHLAQTFANPTKAVAGLGHLAGQAGVVVWADGKDVGTTTDASGNRSQTYSVDGGGNLTPQLTVAASNVVVGLPYTAQWQSSKLLELQSQLGAALTKQKQISGLGLVLANTHAQGLRYGRDFVSLYDLPQVIDGKAIDTTTTMSAYDQQPFEFPQQWTSDERLCLQADSPRPCTIVAAIANAEAHG